MTYMVSITRAFAVALVLVLTATGLWAAGAEEAAGSRRREGNGARPDHRRDGGGATSMAGQ